MQVESLQEVVHWSKNFHRDLSSCLRENKERNEDERSKLLLGYLADHEQNLADILSDFEETADSRVLKTWSYDYLKSYPVQVQGACEIPYGEMSSQEIMGEIESQHNQIMMFYDNLKGRAHLPEVIEALDQLIDLQKAETSRMSQSANRLEDM